MYENYKPSHYNLYLSWSNSCFGIFNTLAGQMIFVDKYNFETIANGNISKLNTSKIEPFEKKGIIVSADRDEFEYYLSLVEKRRHTEKWADITFLSAPNRQTKSLETYVVENISNYIKNLEENGNIQQIKLRFCGYRSRSLDERRELFLSLQDYIKTERDVVRMWITDDLLEANVELTEFSDAFFFLWNLLKKPQSQLAVLQAFHAIQTIVKKKKSVYIQFVARSLEDIENHQDNLALASKICKDISGNSVRWGICIKLLPDQLYFLPGVCYNQSISEEKQLGILKFTLQQIGLPVQSPINLYHLHNGCPYHHPYSRLYDYRGMEYFCLKDYKSTTRPSIEGPSSFSHKLNSFDYNREIPKSECTKCALLPVCQSICPKQKLANNCKKQADMIQIQLRPY